MQPEATDALSATKTSSTNTDDVFLDDQTSEKLAASSPIDNSAISKLEEDLARERDKRLEERFYWITVCMMLLDFAMRDAPGWVFTLIFVMQIIALASIANSLGQEKMGAMFDLLVDKLLHRLSAKKD